MELINISQAAGVIEDATPVAEVLYNTLQFLLSIFGSIAIIALVLSGIIYVTASGNEERIKIAKKAAAYSVVGIIIALSGMVIIKFLTKSVS
jgi:hypothetical protein